MFDKSQIVPFIKFQVCIGKCKTTDKEYTCIKMGRISNLINKHRTEININQFTNTICNV